MLWQPNGVTTSQHVGDATSCVVLHRCWWVFCQNMWTSIFYGIKADAFNWLKRSKGGTIQQVSVCPRPCPSAIAPGVWECALVWAQGGKCYPMHSVFSASLCKHNTNIKLLFLLLFVKGFPSQWRQIAVGTAIVSWQGYSGDVSNRSLLQHMEEDSEWSPFKQCKSFSFGFVVFN